MRIPPLSVIETWPTPNYSDPNTRGPSSLILNIVFIAMVMVAVAIRYYCRLCIKKWFGWDDIMIAMALIFTIGLATCVLLAEQEYGWNRHIWDVEPSQIQNANIIAMVSKVIFTFAATFTRLSLCVFYYRLVRDSGYTWFVWTVHVTTGFNVGLCIAYIFLAVFLCTPVQYYWQFPLTIADGHCLNEGVTTLVAGILNTVADLLVTLVPMPLVARLQLPVKQRIGVSVLFGLGFIVIIAGSIRTYYIWRGLIDSYDETWFAYPLWIAAAVEIDVGVICACAPALKMLLYHARSKASVVPSSVTAPNDPPKSPSSSSDNRLFLVKLFNPIKAVSRFHRSSQISVNLDSCPEDTNLWLQGSSKMALQTDEDGGRLRNAPTLTITRRQSVELEILKSFQTHSSLDLTLTNSPNSR
ncbi:hypothetical protein M433DRAFT_27169 [Acidomyces richmondensis BFW]|nr:MAG: hypothetical protein FE78DRAFT_159582 [Acidomyces sp. 'richmondensis']KYG42046.1 hypothetical protein M433DRAFT_27169 [Acidomyces richmondensis BFW]